MKKIIFPIIILFFAALAQAAIITPPTEETTNVPDPVLTQIIENQSILNEKISKLADQETITGKIQQATTAASNQIIVIFVILIVVSEVMHWLIFFWLIGNHKIPILDNKKEVLP